MNAVDAGGVRASGRTSGNVIHVWQTMANPIAARATAMRRARRTRGNLIGPLLRSRAAQRLREGRQDPIDVTDGGARSHEPDAPNAPGQWTQSRADFNVMVVQQSIFHGRRINAFGDRHGVETRESMTRRWEQ